MHRLVLLGLSAIAALLCLGSGEAQAQIRGRGFYRPIYRPVYRPVVRPYYPPNRMPGWDWEYTYPYSPYNLARRYAYPYPVPYAVPYPVYTPAPTTLVSGYNGLPRPQDVLMPTPTGPLRTPPPNSALIVVRVPAEFTQLTFDGVPTTSVGLTRYYTTPELPPGQPLKYAITAIVNRNGQPVREERDVQVIAGQTTMIDFTRPAGS
jgi:uncharacterized protein (TIGR03000 family)